MSLALFVWGHHRPILPRHQLSRWRLRSIWRLTCESGEYLSNFGTIPWALSAQELAESEHVSGHRVAKTVMAFADGRLIMLVLPASLWVDFDRLREALGARMVRLANEQEFETMFVDCEPGAMPPLGNLYGLPVYVDSHLSKEEDIIFPVGTHTATIQITYADFERLVHPLIVPMACVDLPT